MPYKVFLVEDEVVAREGIRDNVDWRGAGFEFCGEAPDGEVALPLIETIRPDVLITDIKMPFMDGLQLSQLVRERLPLTKIIILSGHDEFHYAQEAIKLGVAEYLLKPVGARDLYAMLGRVAQQLAQEHRDQQQLRQLEEQARHSRAILRERFLLKILGEEMSLIEALSESVRLDLDIVAPVYLLAVVRDDSLFDDHRTEAPANERPLSAFAKILCDVERIFVLEKDLDELVLLFLGDNAEALAEIANQIAARLQAFSEQVNRSQLHVAVGAPQQRISDLHRSYASIVAKLKYNLYANGQPVDQQTAASAHLLQIDRTALESYLRHGVEDDFDTAWNTFLGGQESTVLATDLRQLYLYLDTVLTAARFVRHMGGNLPELLPELESTAYLHDCLGSPQRLKEVAQQICARIIDWRDKQATNRHLAIVQRATEFIDQHYTEPALSLNEIAAHVHLSPSHFSNVFSSGSGETFKEYLTRIRIDKAKELLRTSTMGSAEICFQVGYSDPHYFSVAFKRVTGLSPRRFRSPSAADDEEESPSLGEDTHGRGTE